ncbi:MAG: hypothetical protein CBE47_04175 [Pelagibacteraceae bacterium TMED287]|nr:MAG: hypothetical protein CBE47_04175 [Pelagibacteraceae bacterium TMED287]|tara:strand:+ start:1526 stop:1903 length:378 start_codon:yes stop_codon:yes gene_type:complete
MPKKTNSKLISISELVKKIGLTSRNSRNPPTHTIRYWEKQFHKVKPTILSGNRRFYSEKDVEMIGLIKFLLKDQGLTIQGAKKIINKNKNTLDDFKASSIKATYFKEKIKTRSKKLLEKIKKLKN